MSISTKLNLFLNYTKYKKDEFGNQYFISKKIDPVLKKRKRMVFYNGVAEATKVPPMWHAWLHYMIDEMDESCEAKYDWQKPYQPNLTGTDLAYRPPGHIVNGGKRDRVSSDYIAWEPNKHNENE